jgi:hypothetical protein
LPSCSATCSITSRSSRFRSASVFPGVFGNSRAHSADACHVRKSFALNSPLVCARRYAFTSFALTAQTSPSAPSYWNNRGPRIARHFATTFASLACFTSTVCFTPDFPTNRNRTVAPFTLTSLSVSVHAPCEPLAREYSSHPIRSCPRSMSVTIAAMTASSHKHEHRKSRATCARNPGNARPNARIREYFASSRTSRHFA